MPLRIASRIESALADCKSHSKCPCGLQVALKMPLQIASRIENALADCKSHCESAFNKCLGKVSASLQRAIPTPSKCLQSALKLPPKCLQECLRSASQVLENACEMLPTCIQKSAFPSPCTSSAGLPYTCEVFAKCSEPHKVLARVLCEVPRKCLQQVPFNSLHHFSEPSAHLRSA